MSGYSHDQGVLTGLAQQLRDGAQALDDKAGTPEMVDAGASSVVVANALRDLLLTGVGIATQLDQHAANINATTGAYDDTENTNAGAMKAEREKPIAQRVGYPI